MSIYRKNAKGDNMIVELNEQEIKLACVEYVNKHYGFRSINYSSHDASIVISIATNDPDLTVVRIECGSRMKAPK